MGSAVAACRLSFSEVRGILVPQPGIEPTSAALQGGFLTAGAPREVPLIYSYQLSYEGSLFLLTYLISQVSCLFTIVRNVLENLLMTNSLEGVRRRKYFY